MENKASPRPVPAPRRLYTDLRKTEYENVSIDSINKCLNINSENIQSSSIEKLPNNKLFLTGLSDDENVATITTSLINATNKCILTETNNLYGFDENERVPIDSTPIPAPRKPQNNDEPINTNEKYINETCNSPQTPSVSSEPSSPGTPKLLQSLEMMESPSLSHSSSSSPPTSSPKATGAISKDGSGIQSGLSVTRRAPNLPPKTHFAATDRNQRYSLINDISPNNNCSAGNTTTGTFTSKRAGSFSSGSYNFNRKHSENSEISRSASSTTLNSSIDESNASSESSKYKSPSPGFLVHNTITTASSISAISTNSTTSSIITAVANRHNSNNNNVENCLANITPTVSATVGNITDLKSNDLLKSLGNTSKLLTESLGERIAVKAKGAKHKLDKNFKNSSILLNNIGSETTVRLKSVGKRINSTIGTNFSIGKREKDSVGKETAKMTPRTYDADRPQTVPPNDQVFQTISFSSPLKKKVGGIADLTMQTAEGSYEVPTSLKVAKNDFEFETASKEDTPFCNRSASRSLIGHKNTEGKDSVALALTKQQSIPDLVAVKDEQKLNESCDVSSSDSLDKPSPPMPNFPPPKLSLPQASSQDAIYGKLNPIQPPVRRKRQKNYEQIELRRPAMNDVSPATGGDSMRANIDSIELHRMNLEAVTNEREESLLLREHLAAAEAHTPKPDRSDSWEYYEEQEENESECSSPEPVYVNQDAMYGKVFEMATSNNDLLPPLMNSTPRMTQKKVMEASNKENIEERFNSAQLPPDVIKEFDPLMSRRAATICRSEKSNQLLLLEHLLEEDTYATAHKENARSDDDLSMSTSEEDNINITVCGNDGDQENQPNRTKTVVLPSPAVSAPTPSPSEDNKIQIVHQNAKLRCDSLENIIEEAEEEKRNVEGKGRALLGSVDEKPSCSRSGDPARSSSNRTHWFVSDHKEETSPKTRTNPFNKLSEVDESPPTYLEAIGGADGGKGGGGQTEQKSRAARFMNTMNVFTNVRNRVDALKRKTSFRSSDRQKNTDVKVVVQMIPRPSLSPLLVRHEGPLVRFPSGVVEDILKEMQNRKAFLRDRQFQTFLDHEMKTPKEIIPLEYITTLQCVSNSRVTDNSTHFYCFEITTSIPKHSSSSNSSLSSNPNLVLTSGSSGNCKHQRISHLYGVGKESERGVWMQKILESLTNVLPPKYICHYYRAGWCYLKNSITSEWSGTWMVLKKSRRRLVFVTEATMNIERMDLRKARCIVLKDNDDTTHNLHVETGPMLMIDCPPYTVYMIMSSPRETKIWRHIIREVAHNNGFSLSDQQLTKFNVPVIVDKCINFIYIHGSMSEGIYRKSGSENSILKLLAAFRADAFNVEITRNEYNEHDVANVLKRFMRGLPERLMGKLSESFMCVSELKSVTDKIQSYKELLTRLPTIERETLKRIVGHLAFISSQKEKNKMSVQNLTMIWGPTLLQNHQTEEMIYSQKEADVLTDLITLYKNLFPLSEEEMKKEQEMLICLQKYYAAAETLSDSVKKSGDLKMWITLNPNPENNTEEKQQFNVTISPTKTAYEICQELAPKMKMPTHEISLYEIILNGDLERPLHHGTKVFDVVLSWSYWPEDDRKDNYLAVKPVDILREVQRAVKNLATVTPGKELKFADNRTKNYKSFHCELRDGKIVISKKEKGDKTSIVREIFLHSVTAYLGCEKKRDFPWSWAITFVEKTQKQILRSRDSPYVGHVLAGSEWVDRTIWYSSIWYCLYGESILPPAEIIIK